MATPSVGRNIILGVSGSIAAYKAPSVLRGLRDRGHAVQIIMTAAAQQLVGLSTLRSLSGRPVATEIFVAGEQASLQHIELADWAHMLAVVPATANFIGKAAGGIADELLPLTWMACDCPKIIAPAMNDRMWRSPAVQRNCVYLRGLPGVQIIEPIEGKLASGRTAIGCMARLETIIETIDAVARKA